MAERITQYLAYMDRMLEQASDGLNYEEECKLHLIQIGFFAHERMVHLIVMVLFAVMTVIVFLYTLANPAPALFMLLFLLLVLLIPYIKHYFLLENSVQKMYDQYDQLIKLSGKTGFETKQPISSNRFWH